MSENQESPVHSGAHWRFSLRSLLIGIGVLAVFLALCRGWNPISQAQLRRVKVGMTEAQVLQILGEPASRSRPNRAKSFGSTKCWRWNGTNPMNAPEIYFSKKGYVVEVQIYYVTL